MSDFVTRGMTEDEVYRAFQEYLDKFGFGYCAVEGNSNRFLGAES